MSRYEPSAIREDGEAMTTTGIPVKVEILNNGWVDVTESAEIISIQPETFFFIQECPTCHDSLRITQADSPVCRCGYRWTAEVTLTGKK